MKSMDTIAIVGNGKLEQSYLDRIRQHTYVIGVDRAAFWLLSQGLIPNVAIGDFDSVTPQELKIIREKIAVFESFPPEKDFTDMELAMNYAAKLHPKDITIYGGIGSRLDHSLGNILLLNQFLDSPFNMRLVNETNECHILNSQEVIQKSPDYKYVSLLSLTDESVVTLNDFLYEIKNYHLKRGQTVGISNEIHKKQGSIIVHQGTVLVIQSRD